MYCQECRTPLKLDGSLQELNPSAFKLLADSAGSTVPNTQALAPQGPPAFSTERKEEYSRVSRNARTPTSKRTVGSSQHGTAIPSRSSNSMAKQAPDMSFIMLTDSQVLAPTEPTSSGRPGATRRKSMHQPDGLSGESDSLSDKMETATRLFEILSARSDIDHPICVECTERLVEQLQKRLSNASRERDAYVDFLRQANADVPTEEELQQARQELKIIQGKEQAAFAELESLEKEKAVMEAEIVDLESQALELDRKEEQFWAGRNAFYQKLSSLQIERDRLNVQFSHDSKQLERLRRANVFNDTFSIGHDGYFGTINGLRLGRLSERPVDWSEINAAFGHTCLLLATVADKLNFSFQSYELIPMGSTSKIRHYKTPRGTSNDPSHPMKPRFDTYKLYSSGDAISTLGGLFHSEFDTAMIAFLECLRQLIEYADKNPLRLSDGTVVECPRIGYKIEKDRIGDHSIKLSGLGNQEMEWTKACKLTLICCKFLLAHASNATETRWSR